MRSFSSLMGADPENDELHHFETSWIFPVYLLASIRAVIAAYTFVATFFILAWQGARGDNGGNRRYFAHFANLSFAGVAFYFLFAAIHTFLYARTGRSVLLEKWPRYMRALHSLFYSTIATFPFFVTIVRWAALYDGQWFPTTFQAWINVTQDILPSFFALSEVLLTTTLPLPLLHLPFLYIILLLYLSLVYIIHSTEGFYLYGILDPGVNGVHNSRVAGFVVGIFAGLAMIFGVVWFIIWMRRESVGKKAKGAKGVPVWT